MCRRFFLVFGAIVVLAGHLAAAKPVQPPTVADLSATWSGWAEDGYTFFRLDLRPDGTGFLAYNDERHGVRGRIRHWSLNRFRFFGEVVPIDDTGEAMTLGAECFVRQISSRPDRKEHLQDSKSSLHGSQGEHDE